MKGSLVFIFSQYSPCGGWKYFKTNYPLLPDAVRYAEEKLAEGGEYTYGHIVDAETMEIVWSSKG